MTNINCSANCNHANNGKCDLNHISVTTNFAGVGADCAYFEPQNHHNNKTNKKSYS